MEDRMTLIMSWWICWAAMIIMDSEYAFLFVYAAFVWDFVWFFFPPSELSLSLNFYSNKLLFEGLRTKKVRRKLWESLKQIEFS